MDFATEVEEAEPKPMYKDQSVGCKIITLQYNPQTMVIPETVMLKLKLHRNPMFETLNANQYPILESVLSHLNRFDLNSLRATCRALRDNLPRTSRLLGGVCQNTIGQYCYCKARSPHANTRLYQCPSTTKGDGGTRVHDQPIWQCSGCISYGSRGSPPFYGPVLLRICESCYDKTPKNEDDSLNVITQRMCKCEQALSVRIREEHFCYKCVGELHQRLENYWFDLVRRQKEKMKRYHDDDDTSPGFKICAFCDELFKDAAWAIFDYRWVCLGCKDQRCHDSFGMGAGDHFFTTDEEDNDEESESNDDDGDGDQDGPAGEGNNNNKQNHPADKNEGGGKGGDGDKGKESSPSADTPRLPICQLTCLINEKGETTYRYKVDDLELL